MGYRESLVERLERSRAKMIAHLDEIDKNRKIYPMWTVREILAHLSGWDDATIAYINSIIDGNEPATPAALGINEYNQRTVSTREGLDYDHIYREYLETRRVLLDLMRKLPEEKFAEENILPWGSKGSLVDIIEIFGPHEEEHADDVASLIANSENVEGG